MGGKPKPNSWDAATRYHLVLEGLENPKMIFKALGESRFLYPRSRMIFTKTRCVHGSNLHDVLLCRIFVQPCCPVGLSRGWTKALPKPRRNRIQADSSLGSLKKVIASGHFHLLPLLTSIHHIHRYSFSAVPLKHSKVFFLDNRYVPSS